jgi:hypothetical protein
MDEAGTPDRADAPRPELGDLERLANELLGAAQRLAQASHDGTSDNEQTTERRNLLIAGIGRMQRVLDEATAVLDGGTDGPDDAQNVFAQLRVETASLPKKQPVPKPKKPPKPKPAPAATQDSMASEQPSGPEGGDGYPGAERARPEEGSPDDLRLGRRDAVLTPVLAELARVTKRLLQDEQNLLLDATRRARMRIEAGRLLPEHVHQREAWAAALAPGIDVAYAAGRTSVGRKRRAANAPPRLVNELAANVITPLRERLTVTIESVVGEGPYPSAAELHRELASAIGARYREWKSGDLEMTLGDVLSAAYARGAYDATPSGARLRWVADQPGRCPDCDDNGLEPTVKGHDFPTGQAYPPAHPGCRCVVAPADE